MKQNPRRRIIKERTSEFYLQRGQSAQSNSRWKEALANRFAGAAVLSAAFSSLGKVADARELSQSSKLQEAIRHLEFGNYEQATNLVINDFDGFHVELREKLLANGTSRPIAYKMSQAFRDTWINQMRLVSQSKNEFYKLLVDIGDLPNN